MGSYERAPWGGRGLSGLEEEEARRSFRRRVSIVAGAVVAVAVLAGGSAAWLTAGRAWQLGGEVAALRGQNAQLQGQLGQARGQLATPTAELSQERAADARAEGGLETAR